MTETAERIAYRSAADNYVFNRQLRAYELTQDHIRGTVLEIGSGDGYGLKLLAPRAEKYIALDKYETSIDMDLHPNVDFVQAVVPPLTGIEDQQIDVVVCFQVIEHIKNDRLLLSEIKRVLRPGGRLYMTTPNIKMTLTRNPWHIREYTPQAFKELISLSFETFDLKGIYGDPLVMQYYNEHKASVHKLMKYDILNLQYRLPRWMLQIPFDILDKMNRNKSHKANPGLLDKISSANFNLEEVSDTCLDFYLMAQA